MAGRGRGRVPPVAQAPQPSPTGRGRGLLARPPAPAPAPSDSAAPTLPATVPEVPPSGTATPTAPTSGVPRGRGRGLRQPPTPVPSSSQPAPSPAPAQTPAPEPSPATAPSNAPPAAAAVPSSGVPPPAPVVNLDIDLTALSLSLSDIPLYKRPQKGTKGREIRLQSNVFKIDFKNTVWYKYDVEICTKTEQNVELPAPGTLNRDRLQSRRLNRDIMERLFAVHHEKVLEQSPAYDGRKTLISARKICDEQYFLVNMPAQGSFKEKQFVVRLKCTMEIDVSQVQLFYQDRRCQTLNPEVLQAANIVIDSSLGRDYVAVNRAYYAVDRTLRGFPLSGGKELRSGIYTSMIFAEWKPLLVVDKSNTAFYTSGDLLEYIKNFLGDRNSDSFMRSGLNRMQLNTLSRDLRGVSVKLKHVSNGRCVKINSLTEQSAQQIEFELQDGSKRSVAEYFSSKYSALRFPHLPCVLVVRSNGMKRDYYPLEVCEIKPNQPYRKKLNPEQTTAMIRQCQEPPDARIQKSIQYVRTILRGATPVLRDHGITISETPIETVGRQIASPLIKVKDQTIKVNDGRWMQREFHVGAPLGQWCIVDCGGVGRELCLKLARDIKRLASQWNLSSVGEPLKFITKNLRTSLEDVLSEVKSIHDITKGPMMAVVVLGKEPGIYSQIKRLTETTTDFEGIITQCVKMENLANTKKFNDNFTGNLLKKMNVKLGGINNAIASIPKRLKDEPFIVIGADVSHPGVGDMMTPSIAALVGSIDYIPSKYYTEIRVQTNENNNRIEYIKDLEEIAKTLLRQNRLHTKQVPQHIYYIRDGVSDGQFDEVRRQEIGALRQACKTIGGQTYRPKITVIIAQKRHHTRFNVLDKRDGTRSGNVPPGVYIDRDVVHPENFDLYMYTHVGLLGTSRPTHYHLIHSDDPTFTTDELTEIIYHLCHCYARTTSSVSIPAPIYYAHLAAYRAKEHVKGDANLCVSDSQSMASGDGPIANLSQYQRACEVDVRFRNRLYFA